MVSNYLSQLFNRLYYDPTTGFVGPHKLYKRAKAISDLGDTVTLKAVKDWYSKQVDIQTHQLQKKKYDHFKITSNNPNTWQIDLAFYNKQPILSAININSRIGFLKLLPDKKATTIEKAINLLMKRYEINFVTSDNGSEFTNNRVEKLFEKSDVNHYNAEVGDHTVLGKIDRFIRTIKQRLTKIAPKRLTQKLLDEVIQNYNTTYHSAIKAKPIDMKDTVIKSELDHNQRVMDDVGKGFPPGTTVRYMLQSKTPFGKEAAKWSKSVYEIVGLDGLKLHLRSLNGHVLYKPVNEVKVVTAKVTKSSPLDEKQGVFEVDKIISHKKMKNGKYRYLMRWKNGEETFEPQDNLRLIQKNRMSQIEHDYWRRNLVN